MKHTDLENLQNHFLNFISLYSSTTQTIAVVYCSSYHSTQGSNKLEMIKQF